MSQASRGAELVAIVVSPTVNYFLAVSTLQAGVLLGCPVLLIVSASVDSLVKSHGRGYWK